MPTGHAFVLLSRRVAVLSVWVVAAAVSACAGIPISEPRPLTDLAVDRSQPVVFDMTNGAGIEVIIEGQRLNMLLLAREESLLVLNRADADAFELPEVMFGLGSAVTRDGAYVVRGEVRRVDYSVAGSAPQPGWAIAIDEEIYQGFDGAISFGAIPASRFALQIAPETGEPLERRRVIFEGRSETLETNRSYTQLEFSHELALWQDVVSANAKAVRYLARAGRIEARSAADPYPRLYGNIRDHAWITLSEPWRFGGLQITQILGEEDPVTRRDNQHQAEDIVQVVHDTKQVAYAPTIYLGRNFFEGCETIHVDRAGLTAASVAVEIACRSDAESD